MVDVIFSLLGRSSLRERLIQKLGGQRVHLLVPPDVVLDRHLRRHLTRAWRKAHDSEVDSANDVRDRHRNGRRGRRPDSRARTPEMAPPGLKCAEGGADEADDDRSGTCWGHREDSSNRKLSGGTHLCTLVIREFARREPDTPGYAIGSQCMGESKGARFERAARPAAAS